MSVAPPSRAIRVLFVLTVAAYFLVSAITPTHFGRSTVKIWADPDRAFDSQTKIIPQAFFPLLLLVPLILALGDKRIREVFFTHTPVHNRHVEPPNWLRPPPLG